MDTRAALQAVVRYITHPSILALCLVGIFVSNSVFSDEPVSDSDSIKIASFNIQIFGEAKRDKPEVMKILTQVVRNFDLVAVQEFRDKSETTMGIFLDAINQLEGADYGMVFGPRLGRSSSKEQYAYYYNTDTIELIEGSEYTPADVPDIFEREPFLAAFKTKAGDFDFVLVNIHTKPDDATEEINAIHGVVTDAEARYPDEKDFIVVGDFNADCRYHDDAADGADLESQGYTWVIPDDTDTTVKSTDCAYDRIVFREEFTSEDFADEWGVFRFDEVYGIDYALAVKVSDHYPVWATFHTNVDSH